MEGRVIFKLMLLVVILVAVLLFRIMFCDVTKGWEICIAFLIVPLFFITLAIGFRNIVEPREEDIVTISAKKDDNEITKVDSTPQKKNRGCNNMKTLELRASSNNNTIQVGFSYHDGVSNRWFNYAFIKIIEDGRIKVSSYNFSNMDTKLKFNNIEEAKDFINKRFIEQFS